MPRKPPRPCGRQGCPNLSDGYYCEQHRKEYAKEYNRFKRDPETDKRYSGTWRKIRARFLAANPLCELCRQEGKITPATLVHHKNPVKTSNDNSYDNLQSLCAHHHSQLHMTELNKKT